MIRLFFLFLVAFLLSFSGQVLAQIDLETDPDVGELKYLFRVEVKFIARSHGFGKQYECRIVDKKIGEDFKDEKFTIIVLPSRYAELTPLGKENVPGYIEIGFKKIIPDGPYKSGFKGKDGYFYEIAFVNI